MVGLLAVGLSACGGASSGDQAKVLGGALAKMSTLNSEGGGLNLRQASRIMSKARGQVEGQLLLAKFAREARQPVHFETITVSDEDVSCTLETTSETAGTLTCTTLADDTFSCGETEYTMKEGGTIAMTFSISDTSFSYGMDLNSTIAGGAFGDDGSAFDYSFGFTFTATELEALSSGGGSGFDCDDFDFSCSVGGEEVKCDDLKTAFGEESNACS